MRRDEHVVVIGAGAGGLAAACDLARAGLRVTVIERATTVGGKMRQVTVDGTHIDAGPTVLTMRWVLESLFQDAGADLSAFVSMSPTEILARHAWRDGSRLDLVSSLEANADAIGSFAGAQDARAYLRFMSDSRAMYNILRHTYIAATKPNPFELALRIGNPEHLFRIRPFMQYWDAVSEAFSDPRLRQMFGRYATYVGSSPFMAPATLMLIAHVEQDGVWIPDGGMNAVARGVRRLAEHLGAEFRLATEVSEVLTENRKVTGVRLCDGDTIPTGRVIFNGDLRALSEGLLGTATRSAVSRAEKFTRSLSAFTWCTKAKVKHFPLTYHTVLFGDDYEDEFSAIFRQQEICERPTVYICAQDRQQNEEIDESERLLLLINAPAAGGPGILSQRAVDAALNTLSSCGVEIEGDLKGAVQTGPADFSALFPGSRGALYGSANHGALASFLRPGSASRIKGLYLAGGSVHPGPGVPMATLSGRIAAARLLADLRG